jgi:HSP20 family protein
MVVVIINNNQKTIVMITVRRKPTAVPTIFNMFDEMWNRNWPTENVANFRPAVNVSEHEKHFQLDFSVPGFEKEDFTIGVDKDQLSVSVSKEENKEEKTENYTRREFRSGNFERVFTLPDAVDADKIEAHYDKGILHVFLPKKEDVLLPAKRTISIS